MRCEERKMDSIKLNIQVDTSEMNDPLLPSANCTKEITLDRGVKLIGLRLYKESDARWMTYVKGIQKSLYGKKTWFYLNDGFECIEDPNENVVSVVVCDSAFESDKYLYSYPGGMRIGVSAIVGKNGTGKSTIIDVILRLLNNMSAAIQGEGYVYSSAQHLHYIENMYCALAVYINDHVEILTCKGREMYLQRYSKDHTNNFVNPILTQLLTNSSKEDIPIVRKKGYRSVFNNWFYTIISNYSLYAYNYRDFIFERSNETKINALWKQKNGEITDKNHPIEEDYYWTTGLFYKNDGYQTPIVMQPMRKDGYIDVATVNHLAKRNLISLAFVALKDENGNETFPFRCINQTHHIVAFFLNRHNEYTPSCDELCTKYREKIIRILKKEINYAENKYGYASYWNYCADKTLKIIRTYLQYAETLENIKNASDGDVDAILEKAIVELEKDGSHRTLKWRQCLTFIKYSSANDHYFDGRLRKRLDDIWKWMKKHKGEFLFGGNDLSVKLRIDDMIPPPLANITLWIVDDKHLDEFNKCENIDSYKQVIPFEGLSSGERQVAYTIGDIIYHMRNIGSNQEDLNIAHAEAYQYRYVNLFLDELEQYFHPDLQRRFVKLLIDSINSMEKNLFDGINITLVTHSPFILTDIPQSNILCLDKDGVHAMRGNTFASNIYDLFNDTFMLESTTGELAVQKIEHILEKYRQIRADKQDKKDVKGCVSVFEMKQIEFIARNIGDDYLREELLDMVNELKEWEVCAV